MHIIILTIFFTIVNIPIYRLLFRKFYRDMDEFKKALVFYMKPDIFSLFKGELAEDISAEMKLGLFVLICGLFLACEVVLITELIEWIHPSQSHS